MVAGEDSRATLEPQMFDEVSGTRVRRGKQPPQALRRTCSAGTENSAPPSPAFVRGSAFRTPGGKHSWLSTEENMGEWVHYQLAGLEVLHSSRLGSLQPLVTPGKRSI